jgi:hypothetical protein
MRRCLGMTAQVCEGEAVSSRAASTSARSVVSRRAHGLFLSEAELAQRHGQSLADWSAKAAILERSGFPRIDPLMNGRYWPAVLAWWNRRYGLTSSLSDLTRPIIARVRKRCPRRYRESRSFGQSGHWVHLTRHNLAVGYRGAD